MIEFLTAKKTSYCLDEIIKKSKTKLVFVSPYVNIPDIFIDGLREADRRGIKITLIYGKEKDKIKPQELKKLKELNHLSLYYQKNLHAKCYFNEGQMIITSMNLYEYSERSNYEMGVLVRNDNPIYLEAIEEVDAIRRSAEVIWEAQGDLTKLGKAILGKIDEFTSDFLEPSSLGYCIRCHRKIDFDKRHPYCPDCYVKRSKTEKFCHSCGKPNSSKLKYPLCNNCFQK